MSRKRREKREALAAIYARVPGIACKGLCFDACGPIGMTLIEARAIEAHTGKPIPPAHGIDCPFLTASARCSIYPVRPLVCRLWGVVERLPCPHGCERESILTDEEGFGLLAEARLLSGGELVLIYPADWKLKT
jgi:putative zinc- or iron-chelating protein